MSYIQRLASERLKLPGDRPVGLFVLLVLTACALVAGFGLLVWHVVHG